MKLYNGNFSPNAMRVRAVAYELEIDIEIIELDVFKGMNKTPEFLAINPNRKIPALVDGDFILWESRAINNYFCSLKPDKNLYPNDIKKRALVDQWCYWQAIHLGPAMQKVSFERVMKARMGLGEGDEKAIFQHLKDIEQFLPVLDRQLTGKDWVIGELSVADFALASTFMLRDKANISLDDFNNVKRWIESVEAKPSWKKAVSDMGLE